MRKIVGLIFLLGVASCSDSESVDWGPMVMRSDALLQSAQFREPRVQELGALSDALLNLYDEFLGFNSSMPAPWINPSTVTSFGPQDAVGDASLLPESFWEAREHFLTMHEAGSFRGPSLKADPGEILLMGVMWEKDQLLLLAEFLPPEDPIWEAFLHASMVIWEESHDYMAYSFCYSVWRALEDLLDDWPADGRFAPWIPSWQRGVQFDLVFLNNWVDQFSRGKVPADFYSNPDDFYFTAGRMLTFYEQVSWDTLDQLNPTEFAQDLKEASIEAGWSPGRFSAAGILVICAFETEQELAGAAEPIDSSVGG